MVRLRLRAIGVQGASPGRSRLLLFTAMCLLGLISRTIQLNSDSEDSHSDLSANQTLTIPQLTDFYGTGPELSARTRREPQLRFPEQSSAISSNSASGIRSYDSIVISSTVGAGSDDDASELRQLESDIKLLDEMLHAQMRHKKPSYQQNFHLLPKPNYSFLPDLSPLRQLFQWNTETVRSHTTCYACKVGIGLFLTKARLKTTLDDVMEQAVFACNFFQLSSKEVCAGLIYRFAPTLYFIGTSKADLTPLTFCAMALQSSGCITKDPQVYWNVLSSEFFGSRWRTGTADPRALAPTPSLASAPTPSGSGFRFPRSLATAAQNRETAKKIYFHEPEVPLNANPTKILHLTDIHLDLEYEPGANAKCANAMCCRRDDGMPGPGLSANRAGYYGDYRGCDLPLHSLENALRHISHTHPDIALIYMTGDLVSHEIWRTNIERNRQAIKVSTTLIRKYFPHTTLVPVLGNHETHPVNLYSTFGVPHPLGTDWVYEATAAAWDGWIPKEGLPTFLRAGYFDVQVAPNLRVVVLNTNLCYTLNFWQIYDGRDPGGQLEWLVSILTSAESRGEKVHILGHVPPNQNECWFVWSKNFYQIVSRFSTTVKAQFYGHTHYDGFHLYYDERAAAPGLGLGLPISSIWIGASLTPFTNLNPGYKIFSVDGERGLQSSWAVLDHETWIYNLTAANAAGPYLSPHWYRLYRATEVYQLPNMLPESLDMLVHRMATDERFFAAYHRNYHKAAEVALQAEECDTACRKRFLCNIVTPYFTHVEACKRIEDEVDGIVFPRIRTERAHEQSWWLGT